MGKNQSASGLTNIVQYDNNGNISFVSGSTTLMQISSSGAITTTGVISGSNALSSSYALNSGLLNETGSVGFATTGSLLTVSSSQQQISASQQQISSSLLALTASYNALSSSYTALSASYNTASSSFSTRITSDSSSLSSRTTQIENVYATTGSNTFTGTQNFSNTCTPNSFTGGASIYTAGGLRVTQDAYFSSSVYIKGNVTVFGTQSVSYISSSQLDIGTNIITVNTATPSVRYGGLSVFDSGSTGLTGSIFWDSELNRWIYVNASGSGGGATYGGGMFISGPRNSVGLGCEQGTTACMLLVGQGGDHLTSSMIYHSSTVTCVPNTLIGSTICTTMANASCIGIGTTTPSTPLEIYAATGNQLKISTNDATSANNSGIFFYNEASATSSTRRSYILLDPNGANGSGGDYSYFDMYGSGTVRVMNQLTSGVLALGVGGTNIINITGSSVGIGTSSPGAKLEVAGVDENILKLKNTSGQPALIRFNDTSTTGDPYIGSYGNSLAFGIYGVGESIRINSSRNVGIRTDAPFSLLHVGTRPGAGTTNPSLCSIATISNDGLTGIDLGGNVNANNVVGHINWVNYLGVGNYNTARIDVYANGAGNSGDLRFWTATVASSPTIRLTISSTGAATFSSSVTANYLSSVISSSSNASPLVLQNTAGWGSSQITSISVKDGSDVVGAIGWKYDGAGNVDMLFHSLYNGGYKNTSNVVMTVKGTGNIGIGTTSPATLLDIQGTLYGSLLTSRLIDNASMAANVGGGIGFAGKYTTVGDFTEFGIIRGVKENATSGDYGGALSFSTRPNGGSWTERMRISSTGYVGINVTSACKHLEVGGTIRTTVSPSVYYRDMSYLGDTYQFGSSETSDNVDFKICGGSTWSAGGNFRWWTQAGNSTPIERMRITSGGNVGIGTGDTGGTICRRFEVYCATSGQTSNAIMRLTSGTNGAYGGETNFEFAFKDFGNSANYSVPAKIRAEYYEATGTDVSGKLEFYTKAAGGNESCLPVLRMTISCGGNIGAPSGTNIYNASDSRLKRNVSTITCGINKVMSLNPVKFNWIEGFEASEQDKDMLGFVAQEVQNIIPEAVENFGLSDIYTSQGLIENPLRVNEKFIIPVLVKAIQEQQCKIALLESCLGIA